MKSKVRETVFYSNNENNSEKHINLPLLCITAAIWLLYALRCVWFWRYSDSLEKWIVIIMPVCIFATVCLKKRDIILVLAIGLNIVPRLLTETGISLRWSISVAITCCAIILLCILVLLCNQKKFIPRLLWIIPPVLQVISYLIHFLIGSIIEYGISSVRTPRGENELIFTIAFILLTIWIMNPYKKDGQEKNGSNMYPKEHEVEAGENLKMKYCSHCGKQIMNEAVVCPNCGCATENYSQEDAPSTGLNVLSFFFPLIGLILYCVYAGKAPKKAKGIGKWALIGFLLGVILTGVLYAIGLSVLFW